jgi:hypothetical protein
MAVRSYNDEAAALIWEIKNRENDIGLWKMVCNGKEFNGEGFNDFIKVAK